MGGAIYAEAFLESERRVARLADLDSNQRTYAERLFDHMALVDQEATAEEVAARAMNTAMQNLPTAKEAAEQIAALRNGHAYCYLAFYGMGGTAQYMKIGMTRHPEQRLYGMATGNPLDCLWVFVCKLPTVRAAYHVEKSLLRHMEDHKRRGEWLEVGETDEAGAIGLARQLGEVASSFEPGAGEFTLLGYRDGR